MILGPFGIGLRASFKNLHAHRVLSACIVESRVSMVGITIMSCVVLPRTLWGYWLSRFKFSSLHQVVRCRRGPQPIHGSCDPTLSIIKPFSTSSSDSETMFSRKVTKPALIPEDAQANMYGAPVGLSHSTCLAGIRILARVQP